MSVAYQVFTDWCLPWESNVFTTEEVALKHLENDPELIAASVEEAKTIQDFINLGWISINPIEIISE